VSLVQLSVRVTGTNGRTVTGLGKDAFQLYVDDKPVPITVFQSEDKPVTAGIVLDNSWSMAPKRSEVIAAALAFARASNPHDQMFVVHFNNQVRFGLPTGTAFTGDIKVLEEAISRFQLGGTTALYDGIMLAQTRFNQASYPGRALLVVTDGGDNSSLASLADVQQAVLHQGAVIFAIGIYDPADPDADPGVLTELAKVTGGEAFFPKSVSEITGICQQIAAEIRAQYTLGFSGATDGAYHHIRVTAADASRGPFHVHTRSGYFAVKN